MNMDAKIEKEIKSIKKEAECIALILKKHSVIGIDELELRGAAFTLSAIYNGIEKLLQQIMNQKNIEIPNSFKWHTELLKIAKANGIINERLQNELLSFLGLRHFVRHAYSFDIHEETIISVMRKIPSLIDDILEEIQ